MAAVDPYTSRLEANMRLLTDRLAFMDAQAARLAAENEVLRGQLDLANRRVEAEARARAQEILAAVDRRDARRGPAPESAHDDHREQLSERAAALHDEARTRIEQIRARGTELAATGGAEPQAWPPPAGEPLADLPPPGGAEPAADPDMAFEIDGQRARAEALQAEIDALLELRETVVSSIRETLLGLAERLAAAEREHARGD